MIRTGSRLAGLPPKKGALVLAEALAPTVTSHRTIDSRSQSHSSAGGTDQFQQFGMPYAVQLKGYELSALERAIEVFVAAQ